MEYIGFAVIVGLFIALAPLVFAIIALSATGRLRTQVEALERRLNWLTAQLPHAPPTTAESQAPAASAAPPVTPPATQAAPSPPPAAGVPLPSPAAPHIPPSAPAVPTNLALERAVVAPPPTSPREPIAAPTSQPEPAMARAAAVSSEPAAYEGPTAASSRESDLERVIGGSWLNRIGVVVLLIASALLLKYAWDNHWVTPLGIVAIGIVIGAALLAYSQVLFRKGFVYWSEGIVALGGGVLYLSIYAGWNIYNVIPFSPAFAGMVAVTGAILGLSLARDSERVAFLALVGGFLTPLLLSMVNEIQLFTYLSVLNAGLVVVSHVRQWRSLPVGFLFTLVYTAGWYISHYDPSKLVPTVLFAALFYVEFAALPILDLFSIGKLRQGQVVFVTLNAAWFVLALCAMLYDAHRTTLTLIILGLALAHYAVSRFAPRPAQGHSIARIVYEVLAYTLVAVAIAVRLQGNWITVGWAIEGALLAAGGLRSKTLALRVQGLALLALASLRMTEYTHIEPARFLINPRVAAFAVVIACLAFAAYRSRRHRDVISSAERGFFIAGGVIANLLTVWALSIEIWYDAPWLTQPEQRLAVQLLMTFYAVALMLLGAQRKSAVLSWQAVGLLSFAFLSEMVSPALSQSGFVPIVWALAAVAFVWRGLEWDSRIARATGLSLLAAVFAHLYAYQIEGGRFLLNPRFTTFALVIACYAAIAYMGLQRSTALSRAAADVYRTVEIAVNVLALWALSLELWDLTPHLWQQQQLSLTILWTVYAAGLLVLGIRRASALMRWQGLTLLGIVLVKVFAYDLQQLDIGLRILAFLALGLVLMGVSFLYQRRLQTQSKGKPDQP